MKMNRVVTNRTYTYEPVPMDRYDPPYGVKAGFLAPGDKVKVVKLPGCPRPNVMGHCHVEKNGRFAGLVCCNSLKGGVK